MQFFSGLFQDILWSVSPSLYYFILALTLFDWNGNFEQMSFAYKMKVTGCGVAGNLVCQIEQNFPAWCWMSLSDPIRATVWAVTTQFIILWWCGIFTTICSAHILSGIHLKVGVRDTLHKYDELLIICTFNGLIDQNILATSLP